MPIEAQNWIDRLVEAVAPTLAARRYAARAQIALAREYQSSYRHAVAGRTSTPWGASTSYNGGTYLERRQLGQMRNRARNIYRNNTVGRSLLDTETDNVVAEGFSLQMRAGSAAFNAEAEERFYDWLERADITGKASASDLFRMSWREPRKDGDGGFVLIRRSGRPYLQYIPGDLITTPQKTEGRIIDGVEVDVSGRPIRFWVRDVDEKGKDTTTPIPARDFVYLAHLDDPLAVRGMTVYAPIFPHLDQLDTYLDSVTKAAIMACIFGLIEKRNKPGAVLGQLNTATNSSGDLQKAITLDKDGMLKVIGTDESIIQVQAQQPMTQTPDFIRALMRLICLAFDMPLEIGQKDLSQVNFSGGRIGLIGYYRSCRVKQDWLKSRCWNRIVYWWLSIEKQRQELGYPDAFVTPFPEDYGAFELHGREWDYTDPQTEIIADLIEIDAGILSPQQASEKRGRDWVATQEQIAEARRIKGRLGIPTLHSTNTRDEKAATNDTSFEQNLVQSLANHQTIGPAVYNAIDMRATLTKAGLSLRPQGAVDSLPLLPVLSETLIGGDVEHCLPEDLDEKANEAGTVQAAPQKGNDA